MDSEEIIMQEYNSLRAEIQNAFTSSKTILSMGFGFVSALLSGGILVKDFPLIQSNSTHLFFALVILTILIPLVTLATLSMWLGEYRRIQRAGDYLQKLEKKVNKLFGNGTKLLEWQNYLDKKNLHMRFPYITVFVLIFILNIISYFIAIIIVSHSIWIIAIIAICGCQIATIIGLWTVYKR